ncbi:MAG: uroporphyrinogen decarboxylase/cobalamine-independent methonine synthase family protein [Anaerolineae bacterium]
MNLRLHFDERDWERIERDYMAWWNHDLARPLIQIGTIDPKTDNMPDVPGFTSNIPLTIPADQVITWLTAQFERRRFYGDAFPNWWPNFGPGVAAAFLGATLHSVENTVWFEPTSAQDPAEIQLQYDGNNRWWNRVQDLTRAGAQAWGQQIQINHTDLGGNLDILASLRTTQQLLVDLYDYPEEIARLANQVTALWMRYYDELDALIHPYSRGRCPWAPIWSQGTSYMLQSDFAYMISPVMFDRFVMPDLSTICDHLDYGFYHLDGKGQIPHLPSLLSIKRLRGIQWVQGDGAPPHEEWLDLFQRIRAGGKLCQIFTPASSALKLVRALGGKGFMFTIMDHMTGEEAQAFLAEMRLQDISLT